MYSMTLMSSKSIFGKHSVRLPGNIVNARGLLAYPGKVFSISEPLFALTRKHTFQFTRDTNQPSTC